MALESRRNIVFYGVIAFICVIYIIMGAFMPLTGDDLAYGPLYLTHYHGVGGYVLYVAQHWLSTNGRIANLMAPFWLNYSPRWILLLVNGLMTALMFAIVDSLSCGRGCGLTARMLLVSVLAYTLPWWDSMLLFDCEFNYVWATTMGLATLWLVFRESVITSRYLPWIVVPFAFLSGGMHEALGMPLTCGVVAYCFFSGAHRRFSRSQWLIMAAFALGSLFVFLSRGIWARFGNPGEANDVMWLLVLKSDGFVLVMIVAAVVMWLTSRKRFLALVQSQWTLYAVAAVASLCFSAVSGIVGRSGWFAQVFALIALYRMVDVSKWVISRRVGGVLSIVMIAMLAAHYVEVARYQVVCGRQLAECIEQYSASADGVVYGDYMGDEEKPWWTLHKTRGVPDADDFWIMTTISTCYGDTLRPVKVLPLAVKSLNVNGIDGTIKVGRNLVSDSMPDGTDERMIWPNAGEEWMVVPFVKDGAQLYFITPRDLDPGDR